MLVTYHLSVPPEDAPPLAESVLLEQSVETPREVALRYPYVRTHMLGDIQELVPHPEGGTRLTLRLPTVTAAVDPAQFLNVVYGNSSLHPAVALEDAEVPDDLLARFHGPRFGLSGLRDRLGVYDRPLTCTALKPVGLRVEELADLCRLFAEGGVDVIKDDHYLGDHPFAPFEERLAACQRVVADVADRTGHRAVYVPNLSGTPDSVRRQADAARAAGVGAVMVAPMLVGLPFLHDLTASLELPVLAHPSFAGALRIRPAFLFGRLFRLYGADAVIFANYGGRFSYSRVVCRELAETLRSPWSAVRPAWPVPAGGMQVERVDELIACFGPDTMLLIGGSLLRVEDEIEARIRSFTAAVRERAARFPETP